MTYQICWKAVNSAGILETRCGLKGIASKSEALRAVIEANKVNPRKQYFIKVIHAK